MTTPAIAAPGRLLVVEGIDGAGTTTLSRALVAALEARGTRARWTCEPSDGPIGRFVRAVLRGEAALARAAHDESMALLFAADRRDHLAAEIEPALAAGTWVVSDRYYHSTFAYQGRTEEGLAWIRALHRPWARVPDLTLLLDLPAATAHRRRAGDPSRGGEEIYDALDRQEEVAGRYRRLGPALGERIVSIDGTLPAAAVLRAALEAVEALG